MAKLVNTSIHIGGTEVKQFSEFSLVQGIFAHHSFRLVCQADVFEKPNQAPFAGSKNLIGEPFKVSISNFDGSGNALQFAGLVTQIDAHKFNGHIGDIVISGYSPTIIMDDGPHCKSWEKKTLQAMIDEVAGQFPKNMIATKVAPTKKQALPYTVQYKETAWQFINRMAAKYGQWLFYNGKELVFGSSEPTAANLVFGSNLNDFSVSMQLRPVSFSNASFDYVNNKLYESKPSGIPALAGLNDLGKFAHSKSTSFFSNQPKMYDTEFVLNKTALNDVVNARAAAQSSNLIRFTGSSIDFGVQLGNEVQVSGNTGNYKIIDVKHYCDGQGNYSNNFIAIPASVIVPPITNYTEPECEAQMAVVVNNHDKANMGRIQVRFHWMSQTETSPWLRVCSTHGGGGKGMHFIPEKNEEVIVGFEGGNAALPFVMGTIYTAGSKTSFGNAGNDVKALQTRSGNKIVLNDNASSMLLSDGKGNKTLHDGNGNIITTSSESIKLECGASCIEMKKDGTITINGKNITTTGEDSVTTKTKERKVNAKNNTLTVEETNTINAKNNSITGKEKNNIAGAENHIAGKSKLDGGDVFIN